ncbi:MAG: hypothetical protein D6798_17165 [Deltaproteobacteria bacterium]|nr:MAG: hypothetical protein D6798_17165 [Deltaproteobacteria bacterium]
MMVAILAFCAIAVALSPPAGSQAPDPDGPDPGEGRGPGGGPPASVALGLSIEPPERIVRHRERLRAAGVDGPAAELACRPFAEGLSLCFTWESDGVRRYVTGADLEAWAVDLAAIEAAVSVRAAESLDAGRPEPTRVTDMDATYLLSMEGDGLDGAGWLHPDRLVGRLGEDLRVATPARDVFVAWAGGDDELDKVMAVGVLRIQEASEHPVTSRVYTWDPQRGRWTVWGQAR